MKVLVLGGDGYLGWPTALHLSEAGHEVAVADNFATVYNDLLDVLTPFQTWQIYYFGSTNNPAAAASADPDGDGQNNSTEFLAGTDPTNSASSFRITAIGKEANDIRVTWLTGVGKTSALQESDGGVGGGLSVSFTDLFVVSNTTGGTTNYLDSGAITNAAARYYRVRLVP